MGLYAQRDVETDDGGEVQFLNGDVAVGSVKRSHLQALNWVIASNRGDVLQGDAVADLGPWIGRLNNDRNRRAMEEQIRRALGEQRAFAPGDVLVSVVPIDLDTVAVTTRMRGVFVEPSSEFQDEGYVTLGFVFPFSTGVLERVS